MGLAFQHLQKYTVIHCCECEMAFAINDTFYQRRLDDNGRFFCPAGHPQHFTEGRVKELEKKLAQEQRRREWAERAEERNRERLQASERSNAAHRAAKTRLKNRIAAGVCPCCNRSFTKLAAHMKTKHPGYATDEN